jgi:hypothetical protein
LGNELNSTVFVLRIPLYMKRALNEELAWFEKILLGTETDKGSTVMQRKIRC